MSLPDDSGLQTARARQYWTISSGGTTYFSQNGGTVENWRQWDTNPWGRQAIIWTSQPDGLSSDGDGGWTGSSVSIDHTVLYRFSVWIRRKVNDAGTTYLGVYGYNGDTNDFYYLDGTTYVYGSNAYLTIAAYNYWLEDEWQLVVSHIFPSTYTAAKSYLHPDSGEWSVDGVNNSVAGYGAKYDLKWENNMTTALLRAYLFYCSTNDTTVQQFCYPRIDKCDGTEPTLRQMLRDGQTQSVRTNVGNILLA